MKVRQNPILFDYCFSLIRPYFSILSIVFAIFFFNLINCFCHIFNLFNCFYEGRLPTSSWIYCLLCDSRQLNLPEKYNLKIQTYINKLSRVHHTTTTTAFAEKIDEKYFCLYQLEESDETQQLDRLDRLHSSLDQLQQIRWVFFLPSCGPAAGESYLAEETQTRSKPLESERILCSCS